VNYLLNDGYIVLDNPRRTVKVGGKWLCEIVFLVLLKF